MGKRASKGGFGTQPKKPKHEENDAPASGVLCPAPLDNIDVVLGKDQAAHIVRVHAAIEIIKACPIFENVTERQPLTLQQGGSIAPIVPKDLISKMSTDGGEQVVIGGGNFFWLNHTWLANPRVPFNNGQLKQIASKFPVDNPPSCSPYTFHVAMDSQKYNIMEHLGGLARVSPEENDHVIIFQLAEAIKGGVSDDILRRWLNMLLSVPMSFCVVEPGNARYYKAQNLRESLVDAGDCAKRSVRQRIMDVAGFKKDLEKSTNCNFSSSKLAALWAKNVKMARSSEPVSDSFIDSAVTLDRRLMSIGECTEVLTWCDEHLMGPSHSNTANPFTSVYMLQAVVDRGQTPQRIAFGMQGLLDAYRMKFINIGEFSVKKLTDSRGSYVCVLNLKLDAKNYLLGEHLDGLNIDPSAKAKLRDVFATFTSVRAYVTGYEDEDTKVDISYQANWANSVILVMNFIEDMIYGSMFDARYRDAIKSHLELKDFMEYPTVADRTKEIKDAIASENPETTGQSIVPPVVTIPADDGVKDERVGQNTLTVSSAVPVHGGVKPESGFESLSEEDQVSWLKTMKKILGRHIKLIADDGSTNELASKITNCPLAMMRGDPCGLVMYVFDQKKYGESQQRPELRQPPFREGPYNRLVQTLLQSRRASTTQEGDAADETSSMLNPGELAMIFDGGKPGLTTKLVTPWRPKSNKKVLDAEDAAEDDDHDDMDVDGNAKAHIVQSQLNIGYDADSIAARRKLVRGTMVLKQMEGAHIMSHNKISLPERAWGHYPGNNMGDTLLGVALPAYDAPEVWKLTWKHKKSLYGKKHLVAVGGKTLNMGPLDKRHDDKVEPVCYNPTPALMYEAICKGFFVKFIIDLTPADSTIGWMAILNNINYIGICYTEEHCNLLFQRFLDMMKVEMAIASNTNIYNPTYAMAIGKKTEEKPKPKPKGKTKPKAKPKGAAEKPKKPKKDDAESEGEPSDDNESEKSEIWDPLQD